MSCTAEDDPDMVKEAGLSNTTPLLGDFTNLHTKAYVTRWWILFWFSLLSCLQCLVWITFSSVATTAKEYLGVNDSMINLWINLACVLFLIIGFPTIWLCEKWGLRVTVLLGTFGVCMCAWLRLLVILDPKALWATWTITVAQALNGASGPIVMNLVTKVSSVWFPPHERTLATALAVLANSLGACIGYLIGPLIVEAFDMQTLLYFEAVLCLPLAMAVLCYFPDAPPTPASISSAMQSGVESGRHTSFQDRMSNVCRDMKSMVTNVPLMAIAVFTGSLQGAYNGWVGMWVMLLEDEFSQTTTGYISFLSTLFLIVGSTAAGFMGDRYLARQYKVVSVVLIFLTALTVAWFALSLPTKPFWDHSILPCTMGTIIAAACLMGFFLGAMNPLSYELAAEVGFPLSETYSATMVAVTNNFASSVCLFIGTVEWFAIFYLIMTVSAAVFLTFVPVVYHRSLTESDRKKGYIHITSIEEVLRPDPGVVDTHRVSDIGSL